MSKRRAPQSAIVIQKVNPRAEDILLGAREPWAEDELIREDEDDREREAVKRTVARARSAKPQRVK